MTDAERAELAREIALAASGADSGHGCGCGFTADSAPEATLANGLAHALDLSLPRPDVTRAEAERFLQAARRAQFRSVCVQPRWAALAVRMLAGARSRAASYVGYPHGATLTPAKCAEAELLLRLGVQELWMVADIGSLRSGDLDAAFIDIQAVAQVAECRQARLNVILELPVLSKRQGIEACVVTKLAGAAAAASATGSCARPTEPRHVELMRQTLGDDLEVVGSGAIETVSEAQSLLAAGASRVESSRALEFTRISPA